MAASEASPELKTYQGNCHCGTFKFAVDIPEVKTTFACNCSICFRKAYLWVFPPTGSVNIERGEDRLVNYDFGAKTLAHKFCSICGTGVLAKRYNAPPSMSQAVNARTLIGLDPWTFELSRYDGEALEPAYVTPPFTGKLPEYLGQDQKLYTGSCHCGAVTLALHDKPLPECDVGEDNCSICARNGTTFVYVPKSSVSIGGEENTTSYRFGAKNCDHHFCKTCGVPVFVVGGNGEPMRVNLKVMQGVEWDDLKIKRDNRGQEGYVVD